MTTYRIDTHRDSIHRHLRAHFGPAAVADVHSLYAPLVVARLDVDMEGEGALYVVATDLDGWAPDEVGLPADSTAHYAVSLTWSDADPIGTGDFGGNEADLAIWPVTVPEDGLDAAALAQAFATARDFATAYQGCAYVAARRTA